MLHFEAPPSKSETIRALFAALLSDGISELIFPSDCDDALTAVKIIENLGADVIYLKNKLLIQGIDPGYFERADDLEIECGESATCLRMMLPISLLFSEKTKLTTSGIKRAFPGIEKNLKAAGIELLSDSEQPPYLIEGDLVQESFSIDCSYSSQLLSGLFYALPLLNHNTELIVVNLVSRPYIDFTLEILKLSGIVIREIENNHFFIQGNQIFNPLNIRISGDWSSAAYFIVAGVVKGGIKISHLELNSKQADKVILDAIKKAGGEYEFEDDSLIVYESRLQGINFDVTDCPDLLPALVLLALFCVGKSSFTGTGRLKYKESSRAEVLHSELSKAGVDIEINSDKLIVKSGIKHQVLFNVFNDHRIAMALMFASYLAGFNPEVDDTECINKSYPGFMDSFEHFKRSIV